MPMLVRTRNRFHSRGAIIFLLACILPTSLLMVSTARAQTGEDDEIARVVYHADFADPRRYWDFRSVGRGDVDFEEIIVALNDIGYNGPLSVEWEDSRMNRDQGAAEACDFCKSIDFSASDVAFDSAFSDE